MFNIDEYLDSLPDDVENINVSYKFRLFTKFIKI